MALTALAALGIGAGISGAGNLFQGIFGASQASKAKKEKDALYKNRPQYQIPQSATQALGLAKQQAQGQMPGYDYQKNRLGQITAQGTRFAEKGARTAGDIRDTAVNLYSSQMNAENELGYQRDLYKQQAILNYQRALGTHSGFEDQQFNVNQWMPYQTRMNELSERRLAGQQTAVSGFGGLFNTAGSFFGDMAQMNAYGAMNPQGGAVAAPVQQNMAPKLWAPMNKTTVNPSYLGATQ